MRSPFVAVGGNYKTSYNKDMQLLRTNREKAKTAIILLLVFLVPLLFSDYIIGLLTLSAIAAIGAIGLNILTGYTGQISIGVGAFLGVGGYTTAVLTSTVGISFWIALPLAGVMTALIGGIFGVPSLRLKGLYLAIATLAAQFIIIFVLTRWESLTGGTSGLVLKRPSIGSFQFTSNSSYYYLSIIILVLTVLYTTNLMRTRTGRAFMAVRDRDVAAQIMGINLFKYKVLAFVISSFFIGISGALLAHYTMIVSPEFYGISVSIEYLAMILIGGLGSVFGSILGAVFITLLPVVLNLIIDFLSTYIAMGSITQLLSAFRELVFGAVIIIFLIFEPGGLAFLWSNMKNHFKQWPFSN